MKARIFPYNWDLDVESNTVANEPAMNSRSESPHVGRVTSETQAADTDTIIDNKECVG